MKWVRDSANEKGLIGLKLMAVNDLLNSKFRFKFCAFPGPSTTENCRPFELSCLHCTFLSLSKLCTWSCKVHHHIIGIGYGTIGGPHCPLNADRTIKESLWLGRKVVNETFKSNFICPLLLCVFTISGASFVVFVYVTPSTSSFINLKFVFLLFLPQVVDSPLLIPGIQSPSLPFDMSN